MITLAFSLEENLYGILLEKVERQDTGHDYYVKSFKTRTEAIMEWEKLKDAHNRLPERSIESSIKFHLLRPIVVVIPEFENRMHYDFVKYVVIADPNLPSRYGASLIDEGIKLEVLKVNTIVKFLEIL